MTQLVYTSSSQQRRISVETALEAAEQLTMFLSTNPVLSRVSVGVLRYEGPGCLVVCEATVTANGADKLAVIMALHAADEQWSHALAAVECDTTLCRSQLRHEGSAC